MPPSQLVPKMNIGNRHNGSALAVELSAASLAAVSLISVAILLGAEVMGAAVWSGFVWLAMFGLPAAFLLGGVLVTANIRRRRTP